MFRKLGIVGSKKAAFLAGLLVAVGSLAGVVVSTNPFGGAQVAHAALDCGAPNDVMKGGFSDASNFITKVKNGNNGVNPDLKQVYNYYDLSQNDYDGFAAGTHVEKGKANRASKTVTVNGQTVITNATSVGRVKDCHGSNPFTVSIPGTSTKLYGDTLDKTINSRTDSLDVLVLFNTQGVAQFAVMNICGNPVGGDKVVPDYKCNALRVTPVPGKAKTYSFTTNATVDKGATIEKVVYDFGDGTAQKPDTQEVTTAGAANNYPYEHTYDTSGTYKTTVLVYVSLPGGTHTSIGAVGDCAQEVTVPDYSCVMLDTVYIDKEKMKIRLKATATVTGTATLTGADFDFGDKTTQTGAKPEADGKTVISQEHTYSPLGNYDATAVLHFSVNGEDVTALTCKAQVTPTETKPECKPGVPVDDKVRCNPCPYNANIENNPETCKPPVLPNTGAGNTIAIFSAVAIAGFMVYRQLLFRRHKAAFEAAQMGTSLLPLSNDPLNDDNPLDGTPLDPAVRKQSFRRKRPF